MTTLKTLAVVGLRGASARVTVERLRSGVEVVRIQWREAGRVRTRSFPNGAEARRLARAEAEGIVERLQRRFSQPRARVTLGALVELYLKAKTPEWRTATFTNTQRKLADAIQILGAATYADVMTPEALDELRARLKPSLRGTRAPSQIAAHLTQVKAIFRFAEERKLLAENPIARYRVRLGKNDRPQSVAEYTPEEADRLLHELTYRTARGWRPWGAIVIAGLLGCRQNALLHLETADVDLVARTVRWRAETDKLGRLRVQPLPRAAVFAFRVLAIWRRRNGYAGRYVFPAVQQRRGERPYTYQALNAALHEAERRAGVEPKPFRAMHGLRRMAAKNVLALTGDLNKAGEWIGDTDLRVLKASYLKERPEELRALAGAMDRAVPKGQRPARRAR